jgi:hypothetical protein
MRAALRSMYRRTNVRRHFLGLVPGPCSTQHIPSTQIGGGQSKIFDELRSAVLFVMDELLPEDRGTAMIQTDQGMVSIEEIEKLYKKIKS